MVTNYMCVLFLVRLIRKKICRPSVLNKKTFGNLFLKTELQDKHKLISKRNKKLAAQNNFYRSQKV